MTEYTRTPSKDLQTQQVSIESVDVINHGATGISNVGTRIFIDTSYYVGAVQVTPTIGDQWTIQKIRGQYRLLHRIPFNDPNQAAIIPTQGQHVVGSGQGPVELQGTQININAPTMRLGNTLYRDAAGVLECSTDNGATWGPVATGGVTIDTAWADITGIPATFPPTVPIHWSHIDATPTTFPSSWTTIAGKPSTFPPTPPTGTPDGTKFWRDDDTWAVPPGGGGGGAGINIVTGEVPSGSINGTNMVFTLANAYTTGSTMVYLNGIRAELGLDYTETAGHTITFSTAPGSGDDLRVDYVIPGLILSFIAGEVPSGTKNGTNVTFTLASHYLASTTSVFRNGLREQLGVGYTEGGTNVLTFTTAPLSSDIIIVDYLAMS